MVCPHCSVAFHDRLQTILIGEDKSGGWTLSVSTCPECSNFVMAFVNGTPVRDGHGSFKGILSHPMPREIPAYPKSSARSKCPSSVPQPIREDYEESCLVLADSAKASAALSRRCLQQVLREAARVKPGDLFDEIQQLLDSHTLRSEIAEGLDMVRVIGNFAAHPIKSKNTGEVLPVEPGEAEWNLEVLESLFDFYFVQPAILKEKKDALNKKLAEAGKPLLK